MWCCNKTCFSHIFFVLGLCSYLVAVTTERWAEVKYISKNSDINPTASHGLLWYCQHGECHPWGWFPTISVPKEIFVTRLIMLLALLMVTLSARTKVRIANRKDSQNNNTIVFAGSVELISGFLVWSGVAAYATLVHVLGPIYSSMFHYGFYMACVSGTLFMLSGVLTIVNRKALQVSPYGDMFVVHLPEQ